MAKEYIQIFPEYDRDALIPKDGHWRHLPVLFIHGLNARDSTLTESPNWGRIPDRLHETERIFYYANQDSWYGVEHNAKQIAEAVYRACELTGAPKIHLIAHSKGGVDGRRALYLPGVADKVFSYTTLATPHRGMLFSSLISLVPLLPKYVVSPIINRIVKKKGDPSPDVYSVLKDTTLKGAREFEKKYPDRPDVVYSSYAFINEDKRKKIPHPGQMLISVFDRNTDGIVPLKSTEMPHRQIVHVYGHQEFTHDEAVDMHRRDILFVLEDGTAFRSAPDFIVWVLDGLDALYLVENDGSALTPEG